MMRERVLIRLYPRSWRARYGEEFRQMLADRDQRLDWPTAFDMVRGAIDAHWQKGLGMRAVWSNRVIRLGMIGGLGISALILLDVLRSNVVFPPGPEESDSDPEYIWQYLAILAVIAALLVLVGRLARRRSDTMVAGLWAGAVAGTVIAVLTTAMFLVVNTVFFNLVSQQHDKRIAFAASGWTSMRAYLTVVQLEGALFLIPALALVGGVLGLLGAALPGRAGAVRPT
jgi:hypothetical protein